MRDSTENPTPCETIGSASEYSHQTRSRKPVAAGSEARLSARNPENGPKEKEGGTVLANDEFAGIIDRHRNLVYRIAYSYMRNPADADDVSQDVFVKLPRTPTEFESDDHLKHRLIRVTVNQCKSLFRKPWRRCADTEEYADSLEMPDQETRDLLVELMQLPEKYRVPIVLYYYVGFSTQEIADTLRIPAATVRTRLARGRCERLRLDAAR